MTNLEFNSKPLITEADCGNPDTHISTVVSVTSTTEDGVATYSCADGYETPVGDLRRTCESNGDWSGLAPTCSEICERNYIF